MFGIIPFIAALTLACSDNTNIGDGKPVSPLWNIDHSVDAGEIHYSSMNEFCKSLSDRIGGSSKNWSQARNEEGQLLNACKLEAAKGSGFRGWEVTFLPDTVNHAWLYHKNGAHSTITAVGPAQVKGDFLIASMTVYFDSHLNNHSGMWTKGTLSYSDDGSIQFWSLAGKVSP